MSGSNSTSTPAVETPAPTPTGPSTSSPANSSTPPAPTTESTTTTPTVITTTSSSPPSTSSTTPSTTQSTTSSELSTTSSSTTTPSPSVITSVITQTPTEPGQQASTIIITSTETPPPRTSRTSTSSSSSTAALITQTPKPDSGGLSGGGLIAVAVVVPIVAVALLILGGLFLWRKRKQRKDAEELRRKEVEEYGYNPNNDPTLPAVGAAGAVSNDGPYEMKEDGSSGYRGWGTTAVASSGRKASTNMSGPSAGGIGMAYSDTSPSHGPVSDTRSDNPMVDGRALSPESEVLGAMGPSASQNRGGDIHRGPSNASSSYSAANRSDASGEAGYGGNYNNQYDPGNPYTDTSYGSQPNRAEMSGQPVIRDVQARRNTRIENPSHFPQQSSGISQNF